MTESQGYQQFFAELKRRHVFRVAAVYGIVSFGLIQFAEPLAQALLLPDVFLTYVAAILLLGFPLALVLAWALEVTPDGVRKTADAAPGVIEEILAQPASKRWPAGLMALVGVVALIAGAVWVGRQTVSTSQVSGGVPEDLPGAIRLAYVDPADDPRPSIAVLPFADMSREGDQEYFSDGITEEISNTLAGIRNLRVSARTSAFAYKGVQRDLRQVGEELSVAYLLEGSVRKEGDRLRITVQLIDASSDAHLWSEQYDRTLDDVFAIQTEIAEAIAEALRVSLGLGEGETLITPTGDLEAYDLYLAGRAKMRERGKSVFEAVRFFEAAVARDSGWAPAWAGLAESRALLPYYGPGPDEPQVPPDSAYWARNLDAAEAAARRALELSPNSASAAVALGNVLRDRWDWEPAEASYVTALMLDPDNVEAHQQYAEFLAYVGRTGEALVAARRALALDRSAIRLNVAGYIAGDDARYEEAIQYITEAITLDIEGNIPWLRGNLLFAYVSTDQWRAARELTLGMLRDYGPELLEEVRRTWPVGDAPSTELDPDQLAGIAVFNDSPGALWMALGKPERALNYIERFRDVPPFGFSNVLFNATFDPLREDPRFLELLRIRGLEGRRPIRSTSTERAAP